MARKVGVNAIIGASMKPFSTAMQNMRRDMKRTGREMQKAGMQMTKAISLPLVGLGALSAKTFTEFEQSMAKVKAISGATGKEFESLEKNARDLGKSTRYTSSQVAELQLNLSKLGLTSGEIQDVTGNILSLALATGEDLAQSATVAASVMRAFGLTSKDMGRITDVMADSFSSTALDLEKFSTAMATVAPVARKAGADLERTSAILGVLTNNGVDASTAGTALRNIFLDLAGSGMTWDQAMNQINNSTNPLAEAFELFGKRGATVATVISDNREEITKLTADFEDSRGEAKKMADIMDDTLNGAILRMKSALEGSAIQIGEKLKPQIEKLTGFITKLADKFNSLSDTTIETTLQVAGFAALLGPILFNLGGIVKIYPKVVTAVIAIGEAFSLAFGEALLLVGALKLAYELIKKIEVPKFEDLYGPQGDAPAGLSDIEKVQRDIEKAKGQIRYFGADSARGKEWQQEVDRLQIKLLGLQGGFATVGKAAEDAADSIAAALDPTPQGAGTGKRGGLLGDLPSIGLAKSAFEGLSESVRDNQVAVSDWVDKTSGKIDDFAHRMREGMSAINDLTEQAVEGLIGGVVEDLFGGDPGEVGKNILLRIGDFLAQLGKMLIGYGIAMDAFKQAFSNPIAAIAAGVALVAIGAGIKSHVSKMSNTGGYSASSYSGGGFSGNGSGGPQLIQLESMSYGEDIKHVYDRQIAFRK